MKRFFAALMAVCIMVVSGMAVAENLDSMVSGMSAIISNLNSTSETDLSAMTEDELLGLITDARAELGKRTTAVADGTVMYEDENIRITVNSAPYIAYSSLCIDVVIENFSSSDIIASIENCKLNGWHHYGASVSVSANGKNKATLEFYSVDKTAGINDPSEVQDIVGVVDYFDTTTYETIYTSEPQYWMFGEVSANANPVNDFSSLTDEEIWNLIGVARLELVKYDAAIAEGELFYEDENIRITIINAPYVEYETLTFDVIIENRTSSNIIISVDDCKINGWDNYGASVSVGSNCKAMTALDFYDVTESCEVSDASELQEIVGVVSYFDSDTYEDIFESSTCTWTFGQ